MSAEGISGRKGNWQTGKQEETTMLATEITSKNIYFYSITIGKDYQYAPKKTKAEVGNLGC